jgi:uncharacterized membrane protein
MRSWPPGLLLIVPASGVVLVADAILRGAATLTLVLFVPVVTGSSIELLAGIGMIFVGLIAWAIASGTRADDLDDERPGTAPVPSTRPPPRSFSSGGVVLVGPVPIFLGGYRPADRRTWWMWVTLGVALTIGVWVALAAVVYFR